MEETPNQISTAEQGSNEEMNSQGAGQSEAFTPPAMQPNINPYTQAQAQAGGATKMAAQQNAYNQMAKAYTKNKEDTTPADQALLMLLEGAIRFTKEAIEFTENKELEQKHEKLIRVQKIINVLINSLDKGIGEPTFGNILSLYNYINRSIFEANLTNSIDQMREGLVVLEDVTAMWTETVKKFHSDQAEEITQAPPQAPPPQGQQLGVSIGDNVSYEC